MLCARSLQVPFQIISMVASFNVVIFQVFSMRSDFKIALLSSSQSIPSLLARSSTTQHRTKSHVSVETWRKHATSCFRYVYVKVVRFRCIRSNGNARKRHETGNGNTGYPSCFRNGLTCFCHVSVYGFLQFRPVQESKYKVNCFSCKILKRTLA